MKNQRCLLLLLLPVLLSCGNSGENKPGGGGSHGSRLRQADCLIGSWRTVTAEGAVLEVWQKENDSLLAGKSFFIKNGDTLSEESIRLEQKGQDLFYIPTVKNQNEGRPVTFKLTSSAGSRLIFEAPEHDFPQKITYMRLSDDSLLAEISGVVDGKWKARQFPMARIH